MKGFLIAVFLLLAVASAKVPGQSVPVKTVRTTRGEVKVIHVHLNNVHTALQPDMAAVRAAIRESANPASRIANGNVVRDIRSFPQVVSIFRWENGSTVPVYLCSGSLVDKDIVLTSAGCVTFGMQREGFLMLCAGRTDTSVEDGPCWAATDMYMPDLYDESGPYKGWDIGFYKAAGNLLSHGAKRAKFALSQPPNMLPVHIVGFGRTTPGGFYPGGLFYGFPKMHSTTGVVHLNDGTCAWALDIGVKHGVICALGDNNSGACWFDHGSPLLVNLGGKGKKNRQIGILSRVEPACDTTSEAIYTSLADRDHKKFFKTTVRDVMGGTFLKRRLLPRN